MTNRWPRPWPLVATLCGLAACVSVDYVGKSYAPTSSVEVFLSADDVGRPYETIGEAVAEVPDLPFGSPAAQLQEQLLVEARKRGADAMILGRLEQRSTGATAQTVGQATTKKKGSGKKTTTYTETTTSSDEQTDQLRATLIKYRNP